MIDIATSDFGRQIFRIAAAERTRAPALGPAFQDSGTALPRTRLTDYLPEAQMSAADRDMTMRGAVEKHMARYGV
jgi:hypothetical protein